MPVVVADMVRLQRLTGMRPGEVTILRPCDVDRSGDVWAYVPRQHKTEHHGKRRVIYLGPQAQAILLRYLARAADAYCFSPRDSEAKRRAAQHAQRVTPLAAGNRPGTNVSPTPKKKPGDRYRTSMYAAAIRRACEAAFGMPKHLRKINRELPPAEQGELRRQAAAWRDAHCWAPNQLRHAAATQIRQQFDLDAAKTVLGHSHVQMTEIYAERDEAKAREIARRIG